METSWNATQQIVTDHRNSLESAARNQGLLKRARRNKRHLRRNRQQLRRPSWSAFGRGLDSSPSVHLRHPAI
jgi:hypothetical protein